MSSKTVASHCPGLRPCLRNRTTLRPAISGWVRTTRTSKGIPPSKIGLSPRCGRKEQRARCCIHAIDDRTWVLASETAAMTESARGHVNRRRFLSSVAVAAAAPIAAASAAEPAKPTEPSAAQLAADTAVPGTEAMYVDNPGSDYMVDVIKRLKIDYVTSLAGSTFRGLHESLINYGGNKAPEFITCLHEEGAVGMAHGYAKVAGRPMAALVHGTVGLQHAAMAVYNAWCDRVPAVILVGNIADAVQRRPGVEWAHSMQDNGALLRDCTKWDDQPASLGHFSESLVRAYRIAMTPPMGPVVIVADGDLQERSVEGVRPPIPRLTQPVPPQGESKAIAEAARLLLAAENPVIVADRVVRSPEGMANLAQLAELLGAAVIDKFGRLNIA